MHTMYIHVVQIDIFYLGTCLYELMSLRPLPSDELSEAEYRNMLKMGKRAGFSTKVIRPISPIRMYMYVHVYMYSVYTREQCTDNIQCICAVVYT